MHPIRDVPNTVKAAFAEIRKEIPNISEVVFLSDGTWRYFSAEGEIPCFSKNVDVGILETAQQVVEETFTLPVAFGPFAPSVTE